MDVLAPILSRSPRAVGRFVNVYNLIKSWWFGREKQMSSFLGENGQSNEYKSVLFLLACISGLPNLIEEFMRELRQGKKDRLLEEVDMSAKANQGTGKGKDSLLLRREKDRLKIFLASLENLEKQNEDCGLRRLPINKICEWIPTIQRYSFRVGTRETVSSRSGTS